jgi:hypothetical protein
MTQSEIELAVARATGESLATIRRLGINTIIPVAEEPLTVDWDEVDSHRLGIFPSRGRRATA